MRFQDVFVVVTDWLVLLAVAALLIAVYASWLLSYRTPKAATVGSSPWFSLPPWAQIVAGFAVSVVGAYVCYLLWTPLPVQASSGVSLFLRVVGLLLVGGGVVLWFYARRTLGSMMGLSTASAVQLNVDHRLIEDGPYALLRHPMYLGYWLLLAGLVILYHTWASLMILILTYASLSRRARREEQVLHDQFGAAWQSYTERVPMFFPHRK